MVLLRRTENYLPTLFENFFGSDLADWSANNFTSPNSTLPTVNVKETDDDYFVELAAPGMKKEDFKITFENNVLTISSEKEVEKEEDDKGYSRREFSYQSFQRCFNIPGTNVDSEKITAIYADGILNVKLPKREELKPKPAKEIKVD